ncbi:MATE family efflux transporter [Mucilaginibacter sp. RS28]|uniref:Multidrug-efflux transporter n=1 Tax=Mucilaginibacter straminoryzae TaxID=2932774 RepID=A0A9X1X1Z6_9SPHI|nr:MATE family efflux transporter [Mucilaginibacter straminoryzae]MCJ8209679.1 MATE family efflux transporter [Mucilaginibacter straminoryzae]
MKRYFAQYKSHYRDNLKLAIPVVISQLGHILVQTSDSIIVGHFAGTIALAAVALVNSLFIIIMMVGIGISYGLTPLVAQQNGKQNFEECGKLLANSLLINLFTGAILFTTIYTGAMLLLDHLHQTPEVVAQAKPFLLIMGLSVFPMLIFNTFKQFTEGLGFTKQAMSISIWGNVINIVVGVILVKGMFGIKPMGVRGAGFSTLTDRCIMAVVMAYYVFKSANFKKYLVGFKRHFITWARMREILKIGGPVAMQYTFEVSAFGGAAIIVGTIGAAPQAAHQVALNLASITYMMASGVSAAAAIKSGNYFGAKKYTDLRSSAIASYHVVLVFMSVTALLFTLFNRLLPWIYTSDQQVIGIAAELLLIAAVFQLFDGAQVIGLGVLRGMGDVNIPTVITFLAYWVIGIPVGYVLGLHFGMGVEGVWYGLVAGLLTAAILLYIRFNKISAHHQYQEQVIIAQD